MQCLKNPLRRSGGRPVAIDRRARSGVGSGDWLACALEGLDALCALIDTCVHKKPDVVNVPELVAAKLLDNVGYVLHSS